MPCIVLDILERLSRLTNGFALVGGGCALEKSTGKTGWVEEERKELEEYFKYFIF